MTNIKSIIEMSKLKRVPTQNMSKSCSVDESLEAKLYLFVSLPYIRDREFVREKYRKRDLTTSLKKMSGT